MRTVTRVVSLVVALCAVSCSGGPLPPIGPEPEPVVVEQPGKRGCAAACTHMASLNCEEAQDLPLEDGGVATCADFCVYQHENGIFWNTPCLQDITECVQIESVCNVQ